MNKTAIKNFAIWARVQLIEAAKQRAYEYEITEKGENKPGLDMIGGRLLTADKKKQRQQLISQINSKGYTQVMEEAAYTWFNRFIALRYMEVNGFLPSKVRVFTDENGAFKPEILKEAMTVEIDGLDRSIILDLLDSFPLLLRIVGVLFLCLLDQGLDTGHLHHALLALCGNGQKNQTHDHSEDDQRNTVVGGELIQKVQKIAERLRNQ